METNTKTMTSSMLLNGQNEPQIVKEVNGTADVVGNLNTANTESEQDIQDGHRAVSSPSQEYSLTTSDETSDYSTESTNGTAFEEGTNWQPRTKTESDEVGDPVIDASFASIDPNNSQEFFGALLPFLAPVIKAVAPSAINTVSALGSRAISTLIKHKPKVPSSIMNTLRGLNISDKVLKLLETDEDSSGFNEGESSESFVQESAPFTMDAGQASAIEVVIGTDDRVRINGTSSTPFKRICHLRITSATGKIFLGTGFFIGPRTVATAGHCVYLHNEGGWARSIEVSPGRNAGTLPFGKFTSSRLRSVSGWVSNRNRNYDYGVIQLSPNDQVPGAIGSFGFANYNDGTLMNSLLNTAGYPGDKPSGTMWYHGRKALGVTPRVITYDIDTAGGQSGSPVWIRRGDSRIVVGIHTNGAAAGNSATRICEPVFNNFRAWRMEA